MSNYTTLSALATFEGEKGVSHCKVIDLITEES